MRYIDTGSRNPGHTLFFWLQSQLGPSVTEIRLQSAFFNAEPLGLFAPTLSRLSGENRTAHVLIGSNAPGARRDDILQLVQVLGIPRQNARLGVVQFANAYFHPKTYHIKRDDGSQAAYVGSANLTTRGTLWHVEAGITLDTRDGDPTDLLNQIAAATDGWFLDDRQGMRQINGPPDVDILVAEGVLIVRAPPPPPVPPAMAGAGDGAGADGSTPQPRAPRLRALGTLPPFPPLPPADEPPPRQSVRPSANRQAFPPEVFFDTSATGPTTGESALTGTPLPQGAMGIVIRLTRDDTRIFTTGVGTANINLPIATMPSLRFGILGRRGYPERPRAEFDLYVRYIGTAQNVTLPDAVDSNVMLYGYLPGESGHQNRRMLLPADVRVLGERITRDGMPTPTLGDLAFLEWPTSQSPEFRLTFLQPGSPLAEQAQQIFEQAIAAGQMLADNSCGLQPGISPPW